MQKEQFFLRLAEALKERGVAEAAAARYVRAIAQTLSEDDLAEISRIENDSEIAQMAESIVAVKRRVTDSAADSAPKDEAIPAVAEEIPDIPEDDDVKVYHGAAASPPSHRHTQSRESRESFSLSDDTIIGDEEEGYTSRGKKIFWAALILTLPLTLALLAAYFLVFGGVFFVLCALIVLLIAGLIAGVAVGATVSIVGIIYGITQMITVSSSAPGLYEIGLGVTVAGIVMLGGILVYNIAIRLIPLLIRYLAQLFRFVGGKLRQLFHRAKEACCKL